VCLFLRDLFARLPLVVTPFDTLFLAQNDDSDKFSTIFLNEPIVFIHHVVNITCSLCKRLFVQSLHDHDRKQNRHATLKHRLSIQIQI
jgi:hypothetical protein